MNDNAAIHAEITAMMQDFLGAVANSPGAHEGGRQYASENGEFTDQVTGIGIDCVARFLRDGSIVWTFALRSLGDGGKFAIYEQQGVWAIEIAGGLVANSTAQPTHIRPDYLRAAADEIATYLEAYKQKWLTPPAQPAPQQAVAAAQPAGRQQAASMVKQPLFPLFASIGALMAGWSFGVIGPFIVLPVAFLVLRKWHQEGWGRPSGMLIASMVITGLAVLATTIEVVTTIMEAVAVYNNTPSF